MYNMIPEREKENEIVEKPMEYTTETKYDKMISPEQNLGSRRSTKGADEPPLLQPWKSQGAA